MIEITKTCTVTFMKGRDYLVLRYREKSVNSKKKRENNFRKISCFISKNRPPKVILKHQVFMLTCLSVYPAYPKIHFRIMRTVNPLSQLYINWKFQRYLSVTICHFHRASFMKYLFIAFKTMNGIISWYVLGLQRLFHFIIIARLSFLFISLCFLIFLWSTLLAEALR